MSRRDYPSDIPHFSPSPAGETLKLRKVTRIHVHTPRVLMPCFMLDFSSLYSSPGIRLSASKVKKDVLLEDSSGDCHRSLCGVHRLRLQTLSWKVMRTGGSKLLPNPPTHSAPVTPYTSNRSQERLHTMQM